MKLLNIISLYDIQLTHIHAHRCFFEIIRIYCIIHTGTYNTSTRTVCPYSTVILGTEWGVSDGPEGGAHFYPILDTLALARLRASHQWPKRTDTIGH